MTDNESVTTQNENLRSLVNEVLNSDGTETTNPQLVNSLVKLSNQEGVDIDTLGLLAIDLLGRAGSKADRQIQDQLLQIAKKAREKKGMTATVFASLFVAKENMQNFFFGGDTRSTNDWTVEGLSSHVADQVLKRECQRFIEMLIERFPKSKKGIWTIESFPSSENKLTIWMSKKNMRFDTPRLKM